MRSADTGTANRRTISTRRSMYGPTSAFPLSIRSTDSETHIEGLGSGQSASVRLRRSIVASGVDRLTDLWA